MQLEINNNQIRITYDPSKMKIKNSLHIERITDDGWQLRNEYTDGICMEYAIQEKIEDTLKGFIFKGIIKQMNSSAFGPSIHNSRWQMITVNNAIFKKEKRNKQNQNNNKEK